MRVVVSGVLSGGAGGSASSARSKMVEMRWWRWGGLHFVVVEGEGDVQSCSFSPWYL